MAAPKEHGVFGVLQPADLVDRWAAGRVTGCVRIECSLGSGLLWLQDGTVLDCSLGNLKGATAFHCLMGIDSGTFALHDQGVPPAPSSALKKTVRELLNEHAGQAREWRDVASKLPPPASIIALNPSALERQIRALTNAERELSKLLDAPRPLYDLVEKSGLPPLLVLKSAVRYLQLGIASARPPQMNPAAGGSDRAAPLDVPPDTLRVKPANAEHSANAVVAWATSQRVSTPPHLRLPSDVAGNAARTSSTPITSRPPPGSSAVPPPTPRITPHPLAPVPPTAHRDSSVPPTAHRDSSVPPLAPGLHRLGSLRETALGIPSMKALVPTPTTPIPAAPFTSHSVTGVSPTPMPRANSPLPSSKPTMLGLPAVQIPKAPPVPHLPMAPMEVAAPMETDRANGNGARRPGNSSNPPGTAYDSAPPSSDSFQAQEEPGQYLPHAKIGRYEVLSRLGRGGMGTVYLVRLRAEGGFSRLFALKVLRSHLAGNDKAASSLLLEARIASRLNHANIVGIVDAGQAGRQPYIVMEYVHGRSLAVLLQTAREHATSRRIVAVLLDALAGLAATHSATDTDGTPLHLIHHDVSPHNFLVGVDGVCRLTDFGVAGSYQSSGMTADRGKPAYVSPERVRGLPVDARSDIFSMGVLMWTALTGVRLFDGESVEKSMQNILHAPVPLPSHVNESPPCLDAICMKALARSPEERYQTAQEMYDDLRRIAGQHDLLGSPPDVAVWVRESMGELANIAFDGGPEDQRKLARSVAPSSPGDDANAQALRDGSTIPLPSFATPSRVRVGAQLAAVFSAIGVLVWVIVEPNLASENAPAQRVLPTVTTPDQSAVGLKTNERNAEPSPTAEATNFGGNRGPAIVPVHELHMPSQDAKPRQARAPRDRKTAPAPSSAPERGVPAADEDEATEGEATEGEATEDNPY